MKTNSFLHHARFDWNKKLVVALTRRPIIPCWKQLKRLKSTLSKKERWILSVSSCLILISSAVIMTRFFLLEREQAPLPGGEYKEALIGQPQFVNPVLATNNEVDMDLTRLIYSGLLKYNERLELEPDIALSYEISEDGKEYIFYLNPHVLWHDGEALTANDVMFTVNTIKDPAYLSPLQSNFRGITVEKRDDNTVAFILKEPFAPFLNSLTFGILPQHLWGEIDPKNFPLTRSNLQPVGTGPFRADSFVRDELGAIRSYSLIRNETYYEEKPFIEKITFRFYQTMDEAVDALQNNHVMALNLIPRQYRNQLNGQKNLKYYSLFLPQYTALFFNLKDNPIFNERDLRRSLAESIDRYDIIQQVFQEEAVPVYGPIPAGFLGYHQQSKEQSTYDPGTANQLLDNLGWDRMSREAYIAFLKEEEAREKQKLQSANSVQEQDPQDEKITSDTKGAQGDEQTQEEPKTTNSTESGEDTPSLQETRSGIDGETPDATVLLEIGDQPFFRKKGDTVLKLNLVTVDHPELSAVAKLISEYWQAVGIKTNVTTIEVSRIASDIIRPRAFDILLYGELVGADPDPYPYWHSSQTKETGLNLSQFSHRKVDDLLEKARMTNDPKQRASYYYEFQEILLQEIPAIFLYYPTYAYSVNDKVQNITASMINHPSDRFTDIEKRFIKMKSSLRWDRFFQFLLTK